MSEIDSKISILLSRIEIRMNIERTQTLKGQASDGKEKVKSTPKRSNKIGRNEPCPCGSGKKYKQCCGK